MADRKKPGVAFWAAVALAVLLAYPLSFGPACWIISRRKTDGHLSAVYLPIGWAMYHAPEPINRVISGYALAGMPRKSSVAVLIGYYRYKTLAAE